MHAGRAIILAAAALAGIAGAAGIGGARPTQSDWTLVDLGQAIAANTSDPTAIVLPDGRIRLYFAAFGTIRSAISTDGTTFATEAGTRLSLPPSSPAQPPHARVLRLDDGRYRIFFPVAGGIGSAISGDGLSFTVEPGLRVSAAAAGISSRLSTGDVVRTSDGRYRIYFSSLSADNSPTNVELVKSATSSNLLDWTVDPGVRVGTGASALTGSAEHPTAFTLRDGSVALVYGRRSGPPPCPTLYLAVARDGLAFTSETPLGGCALDAAAVARPDGTFLLYYGNYSAATGGTIRVGRLTPPAASPTTTAVQKPRAKAPPRCRKGQRPSKKRPCRR